MAQVVRLSPVSTQKDWMAEARCRGRTELYFAPFGEQAEARGQREVLARAICSSCPVLDPCRDHARTHREQGFWGGENDDERLLARRRARPTAPVRRSAAQG